MLEPDSGAQGRKHLAEALRDLRRAAGLSGERLGVRAAMSQSKVSRIESGKIVPTVVDVERILKALEVPPEVERELLSLARTANVDYTSWRSYARVGLWRRQAELKALAESSTTMRHFLPIMPSGLLQTRAYACAVLTPVVEGRPARDVDRAVCARLDRQEVLKDEARQFHFLLAEQALRLKLAPTSVMVEQLQHIVEVAEQPNIELTILPTDIQLGDAPLNSFVVYDDRLVMAELFSGGVALREPQEISYHLNLFEYFNNHAVSGEEAQQILEGVAGEFMRERD
jgi:transcriptional regulator with XRE-family HTH domain